VTAEVAAFDSVASDQLKAPHWRPETRQLAIVHRAHRADHAAAETGHRGLFRGAGTFHLRFIILLLGNGLLQSGQLFCNAKVVRGTDMFGIYNQHILERLNRCRILPVECFCEPSVVDAVDFAGAIKLQPGIAIISCFKVTDATPDRIVKQLGSLRCQPLIQKNSRPLIAA